MALRFLRNLLFALLALITIGIIDEVGLPLTQGFESYLEFVLTTDFNVEPFVGQVQRIGASVEHLDLSTLLQGLPRITTGR